MNIWISFLFTVCGGMLDCLDLSFVLLFLVFFPAKKTGFSSCLVSGWEWLLWASSEDFLRRFACVWIWVQAHMAENVFSFSFTFSFWVSSQFPRKANTFGIVLKNGFIDKNSNMEDKRVCWEIIQASWVVVPNKISKSAIVILYKWPFVCGFTF